MFDGADDSEITPVSEGSACLLIGAISVVLWGVLLVSAYYIGVGLAWLVS